MAQPEVQQEPAGQGDPGHRRGGYTERRYLDDPPSATELREVVAALGLHPRQLVRLADARKADVDVGALGEDAEAWIDLPATRPSLIERPVLIDDAGRAVIGRPPEAVEALLD